MTRFASASGSAVGSIREAIESMRFVLALVHNL
jgi:hypothetical protein